MAERNPNIPVIMIIQRDYTQGTDNQIVLKNPHLLLSRDALKVTRLRKAGNQEMGKAFDIYQANAEDCWPCTQQRYEHSHVKTAALFILEKMWK